MLVMVNILAKITKWVYTNLLRDGLRLALELIVGNTLKML